MKLNRVRPYGIKYTVADGRISDLQDFYSLLAALAESVGGTRTLAACSGRMRWPKRGVYSFMEDGENRPDSGRGLRIVRVGTHALKEGSGTKLWTRLSQHRGHERTGGGNHRGSIFRLIVGNAIMARHGHDLPTWGEGTSNAWIQLTVTRVASGWSHDPTRRLSSRYRSRMRRATWGPAKNSSMISVGWSGFRFMLSP
jgi:hypothetical protein